MTINKEDDTWYNYFASFKNEDVVASAAAVATGVIGISSKFTRPLVITIITFRILIYFKLIKITYHKKSVTDKNKLIEEEAS